jgi:putative chitinase
MITLDQLAAIAGRAANENMRSVLLGLDRRGRDAGLDLPHRLAHFIGQLAHESGAFAHDREVWGPTPAQRRYEGRRDLGNTQPGDGSRFRGRGPIQVTGRANYLQFTAWARRFDPKAPDFTATPDALNTDPWEGLSPIWYWETRGLNSYADRNDPEMLTRRINGGLNGYADRLERYTRAALVLLGYGPTDVRRYQSAAGLAVDGVAGPRTRAALHRDLVAIPLADPEPPLPETPADACAAERDRLARIAAILDET